MERKFNNKSVLLLGKGLARLCRGPWSRRQRRGLPPAERVDNQPFLKRLVDLGPRHTPRPDAQTLLSTGAPACLHHLTNSRPRVDEAHESTGHVRGAPKRSEPGEEGWGRPTSEVPRFVLSCTALRRDLPGSEPTSTSPRRPTETVGDVTSHTCAYLCARVCVSPVLPPLCEKTEMGSETCQVRKGVRPVSWTGGKPVGDPVLSVSVSTAVAVE